MICGIDFSSRAIDLVLLDDETDAATWHRVPLTGQDAFERTRAVRAGMLELGSGFFDETIAVGIEEPRGYGAGSLYRIQGAVLASLPRGVLVHPLIPSSWRKACGLPGNASKAVIASHARFVRDSWMPVEERWDWPQDALDAYCIAVATRSLIELGEAA